MTETADSEFPPPGEVNWELLKELYDKPHPLMNNNWQPPKVDGDPGWIIEMYYRERAVHHLLDLAGVPHGYSLDTRAIDDRVLIAVMAFGKLRERLGRISDWHARETGPAGTVGDFCTECGNRWPCDSRRMADGTYTDAEDDDRG
jgi:hypothetical protein